MTERSEVIIGLSPPGRGGSSPPDHDPGARSGTGRDRRGERA
ncbi:MAG TPA: hypothetical protein VI011_01010 [Asanoa sp.]